MDNFNQTLTQLLVSEAVRELEVRFENIPDKNTHVETHIQELGQKPGFAMASQLCRDKGDIENLDGIIKFISGKFSQAVFGVKTKSSSLPNPSFSFEPTLPSWFLSIAPKDATSLTPQQFHWFKAYANFIAGVYCGAFTHFGYKANPTITQCSPSKLQISFNLVEFEGTWEFAAATQH